MNQLVIPDGRPTEKNPDYHPCGGQSEVTREARPVVIRPVKSGRFAGYFTVSIGGQRAYLSRDGLRQLRKGCLQLLEETEA